MVDPTRESRSHRQRRECAAGGTRAAGGVIGAEVADPGWLAPLPQEPQQDADARGDQHRLERLLVDVRLEALFPLARAVAALVVVVRRLVAELLVPLCGCVADLAAK